MTDADEETSMYIECFGVCQCSLYLFANHSRNWVDGLPSAPTTHHHPCFRDRAPSPKTLLGVFSAIYDPVGISMLVLAALPEEPRLPAN
jgi:hypothetical protein